MPSFTKKDKSIVKRPAPKIDLAELSRKRQELLVKTRDELLAESMRICRDLLAYRDIGPGAATPPEEWLSRDGLSPEEAEKRLRLAKAAWMNQKDAPVGNRHAIEIALGILKAEALTLQRPQTLNMQVVQVSAPPDFPRLQVEK